MINGLNVIGLGCIFTFVMYLVKVLKKGPYITNFGKGDTSRIKKIYIIPANKVTSSGKAIMSQFKPRVLNIRKGDTVEFINDDKIRHAIEIGNGKIHNSEVLIPGGVFSVTIEENGTIAYRSSLYPHIGNGFINVVNVGRSSNSLQGTIGKFFGNNKSKATKTKSIRTESIRTESIKTESIKTAEIRTEGIKAEGVKVEGVKTEGILEKKIKNSMSIIKPAKKRLKRVVKSTFKLIYGIGPVIDSILDVFDLCSEKGLIECIKDPKTKKVGLYLCIFLFIIIGGLYIYKNLLSGNLFLPVQIDGGDIKVAIN
jgi:plastocyanin